MWDLNRAERKALGSALLLVGVGAVARAAVAPAPGHLHWQPAAAERADLGGLETGVLDALAREQRAQTPLGEDERIDVNRAPAEELRRLPGVGPGLADAIVRERRRRPFRDLADIERVAGIGPVTASRLGPHVTFSDAGSTSPDAVPGRGPTRAACPGRPSAVDVNRAGRADLERLPGVGPVLAARIIEERTSGGFFESPAALIRVRGIGARSLEVLDAHVCTGTP